MLYLLDLPTGSTIHSATLYLYSDPSVTSNSVNYGNSQQSGSNAFYLERIVGSLTNSGEWHENFVTWNNQPASTTTGRIWVGPSSSATENRQVNITTMAQGWVNNPGSNIGIKMILENELSYRARNYASTNHSNSSIHPKLVITFTAPVGSVSARGCSTPEPTEEEYTSLPWFGNDTFLSDYYDRLAQNKQQPNVRHSSDAEYAWLRIPIKLWIYRNSATVPGGTTDIPNERGLQRMMDNLNGAFRNNGIHLRFYLESIQFVDKPDAVNVDGFFERNSLARDYRTSDAVNIHIVNGGDVNNYNSFYNAIFIARDRAISEVNATTFTHEVGHFFGLMHTFNFDGILCFREPVTRGSIFTFCPNAITTYSRRCNFTGDLLCDTEADPDMSEDGDYDPTDCTWDPQGKTDFRGDLYRPNPNNYMAYGNLVGTNSGEPCRSFFSAGQRNQIMYYAFDPYEQYKSNWEPTINNAFDRYEPDNDVLASRNIEIGVHQYHTFHNQGRPDNVDWFTFQYPPNGSLGNYQVKVTNISASAVGALEFFRINNSTPPSRVQGVISSTVNNVTTYTIPCASMSRGANYAFQVPRGNGSGTLEYEIELLDEITISNVISGPDAVCSNTNYSTFSLASIPSGASVSWRVSTGLTVIDEPIEGQVRVRSTSSTSGSATIEARVTTNCGSSSWLTKTVFYGNDAGLTVDIPVAPSFCPNSGVNVSATVNNYGQMSSYEWLLPDSEWRIISQSISYPTSTTARLTISLRTPYYISYNAASIGIKVIGNCSNTVLDFAYMSRSSSCGGTMYSVYPNPTSSEVTIESVSDDPDGMAADYEYVLYDAQGTPRKSEKHMNGRLAKIDVRGLSKGLYHLIISSASGREQHHIQIE